MFQMMIYMYMYIPEMLSTVLNVTMTGTVSGNVRSWVERKGVRTTHTSIILPSIVVTVSRSSVTL